MAHGLVEATGLSHFRYDPSKMDDVNYSKRVTTAFTIRSNPKRISITSKRSLINSRRVGRERSRFQLEVASQDRRVSEKARRGSRNSEIGVRTQRASLRSGVLRFGTGDRFRITQDRATASKASLAPFRPLRGFRNFRGYDARHKTYGDFYGRRRRAAQLVAAIWVYAELLARRGYKKLPLKRYNYGLRICPEPVALGRTERQHLHRSGFLG